MVSFYGLSFEMKCHLKLLPTFEYLRRLGIVAGLALEPTEAKLMIKC